MGNSQEVSMGEVQVLAACSEAGGMWSWEECGRTGCRSNWWFQSRKE